MLIRITLEYDGTGYSGWQVQSGQDSIQARIEYALERIFAEPIRVHGAGRTDAGVHARGQVAAFRLPRPFEPSELMRALNALLPPAIAITGAACAEDSFDPRRDARSRSYEYRILNQQIRSVFEFRYSWLVRDPLDLGAMNEAAAVFLGEHDFASMRSLGSAERTTVRRVLASEWGREGKFLTYRVEATAFLRHMVRTMVAAMVEAGRGAATPKQIAELLASRNRARAPAPAPACGLYLVEVRY
ncbi:MAG: tRNA pseudouridine(38-40) synthase TruA [Deltaproteobacteria bacterium]|nr:tRNA pseudouridine(38-40) synthase TruA [Deltaproteobacteria bacterium]MBV8454440.1 tRNA pseudouridine(38-40) synthase TruA [Deltaproteobacteria bacterium]